MLRTVPCTKCAGQFVVRTDDVHANYVCGLCHMPSRAGKTKNTVGYTRRTANSLVH